MYDAILRSIVLSRAGLQNSTEANVRSDAIYRL